HQWMVWPDVDFPRTPMGKPKLAEIRARAAQLHSAANDDFAASLEANVSGASTPTLAALLSQMSRRTGGDGHLGQKLGLSSLDRVDLLPALEKNSQVDPTETVSAKATTVSDIQRLLQQPSPRRSEYIYPRWAQREPVRWFRLAVYYALVWPATQI